MVVGDTYGVKLDEALQVLQLAMSQATSRRKGEEDR